MDFQGTLGKVSSSSVQHPRQMVDLMHIAKGQEQVFLPLLSLNVTLHVNLFKDVNVLMAYTVLLLLNGSYIVGASYKGAKSLENECGQICCCVDSISLT